MATTCGLVVPSGCVPWVSGSLKSFDWASFTTINCQPSIGHVVAELDKVVKKLQDSLDMSKVNSTGCDCDCVPTPADNSWWNFANSLLACVCDLQRQLETPKDAGPRDITNDTVMVNMQCLTGTCSAPPYKVGVVFDTIFAKLCEWDAYIKSCGSSSGGMIPFNSSSRVYIPNY